MKDYSLKIQENAPPTPVVGMFTPYQMCNRLVMDTTDPDIEFDKDGTCQYWHQYQELKRLLPSDEVREQMFHDTVSKIKTHGMGREYDCVVGLSGGVDSSYLAHVIANAGIRPLVVHFDNGWNNEIAVANIESICKRLHLPLQTYVMSWPEFRDLQRAYFKASVIDLEVPTDHMIFGALYKIAAKRRIRYIISGSNYQTEWLLPRKWYYRKSDLVNLRSIHRTFGSQPMRQLPALGVWQHAWYRMRYLIDEVKLLELVDYKKEDAKQLLNSKYGWRDYGGKHYESIFTRFFQGYILPHKFNVDKRKAHLSNLILSEQINREEALKALEQPTYDPCLQEQDKQYVAKKLGFTEEEFEAVLSLPNRQHEEFNTDTGDIVRLRKIMGWIRPLTRIAKGVGWRTL